MVSTKMKVSAVIPVLNETENLPHLIADLKEIADTLEIIIADGGSTDGTREWARDQQGLSLIDAPRGKGPQLNAGAAQATGDVLLFLHADCRIGRKSWQEFQSAIAGPHIAG